MPVTTKEDFADQFAAALTADTMDAAVRNVVTGLLLLDSSGEKLAQLMRDDLATPLHIEPVVFKRTRKLLMVTYRPAAPIAGLGQFDWLTFGLTKLIDVATQIGTGYVSTMLKEDLAKTTAEGQLRIEQERTRQAQLAADAAKTQAAGQVATAQLSQAGLLPGMPGWVLPVGIGAAALFLFMGHGRARRNPLTYQFNRRHRRLVRWAA